MRTPPEVTDPGSSMIKFEPSDLICSSTRACAPAPTAIIVITAATPMMMPSMVSVLRSLFTRRARSAMRMLASQVMLPPPNFSRRRSCRRRHLVEFPQHRAGIGGLGIQLIADDVAVAKAHDARGKSCDIVLVGDEHDRHAAP